MIILLANLLYVLLTYLIETWISPGLTCKFTLVYSLCATREISICYTATTNEVYTFKNKNKRKSLREIFAYHFLFCICLFLDTNLRKQKHALTT